MLMEPQENTVEDGAGFKFETHCTVEDGVGFKFETCSTVVDGRGRCKFRTSEDRAGFKFKTCKVAGDEVELEFKMWAENSLICPLVTR